MVGIYVKREREHGSNQIKRKKKRKKCSICICIDIYSSKERKSSTPKSWDTREMKEPMWANGNLRLKLPRQNIESALSASFNISYKSLNTTPF